MAGQPGNEKVKELFFDKKEELLGVLGQSYLASLLSSGSSSKSAMVLTNKRLYQKGMVYERPSGKEFKGTKGSKVVSLEDITGTSLTQEQHPIILLMGLLAIGIGLIFLYFFGFDWLIMFFLLLGIATVVVYFTFKTRWFTVEYAGGQIATNADWYSQDELQEFQKIVSLTKDEAKQTT